MLVLPPALRGARIVAGFSIVSDSIFLPSFQRHDRQLIIELRPVADRWVTHLSLQQGDDRSDIFSSVEGDNQSVWPASPPVQDPLQQDAENGPFIAGVGMAGRSHWSIVIATVKDEAAFDFDFACRVRERPDWLGSQYELNGPSVLPSTKDPDASDGQDDCQLTVGTDIVRISSANDPCACQIAHDVDGHLHVIADTSGDFSKATTLRWKYRVAVVSHSEA